MNWRCSILYNLRLLRFLEFGFFQGKYPGYIKTKMDIALTPFARGAGYILVLCNTLLSW